MTTACLDRRASPWPWVVVGLWLASAAAGLWYFDARDQRPFETDQTLAFDAGARAKAAENWYRSKILPRIGSDPIAATVVHVYSDGCSCNRFTDPHVSRIVARYGGRGVRFIAATSGLSMTRSHQSPGLLQITLPAQRDLDWLQSTPAALVYDSAGRLVYFGPYSSAAWCGASGGLVERILDRLLVGQTPRLQPFYSSGCFCPARNKVHND